MFSIWLYWSSYLIFSWEFRSEDHDISFGIVKKMGDGSTHDVVPIHKVSANQLDEVGIVTCETLGTCKFDGNYYLPPMLINY